MELKNLWYIILHRKWIIIQAFVVVSLTAVAGSLLMTPVYRVTAKLAVDEAGVKESILTSLGVEKLAKFLSSDSKDEMASHIELIKTRNIREKVIDRLQLKNKDGTPFTPEQIDLDVEQIEETNLLTITHDSSDPKEAAQIVNTLIEVYIDDSLQKSNKTSREMVDYIKQQQEKNDAKWNAAIDAWVSYMVEEKITDLDQEKKIFVQNVADLRKEWEENERGISELNSKITEIQGQMAKIGKYQITARSAQRNPQIEELKRRLVELNINMESSKTKYTASHPAVMDLENQIRVIKNQLDSQMQKTFKDESESINPFYQSLIQQLGDNQILLAGRLAKKNTLPDSINKYLQELSAFPLKISKIQRLTSEVDIQTKSMTMLIEKLYEIELTTLVQSSNITSVEKAIIPERPIKPKLILNTAAGMFLGLFFGLGLAFLIEYLDDALKTPDDIKEFEPLPLLGTIPKSKKEDAALIYKLDPRSPMPEAFRTIKNNIRFAALDQKLNVILITSALPGEGKSFSVGNLGISFARDKFKVLLIDIDLRKPSLHKLFNVENNIGLSNLIRKEDLSLEEIIQKTEVEDLFLLPSGPVPPNPDQFIESPRLEKIIGTLKEKFDMLIIDTPPVFATQDSIILSKYADATISVLESGRVTKKALAHTLESMGKAKIPLMGVIFNKIDQDHKGSYYYSYYHSALP